MAKRVLERDISKKWIADHLADHEGDYAFRIHDCPWSAKNFDAFLHCGSILWALEFKIDRRKTFRYTIEELPNHQLRALKEFTNGSSRQSKVVVYHLETNAWKELEIKP